MERNLIFVLFVIIFVNLIVSICLIVKRRKKDKKNDLDISVLRNSLQIQEGRTNKNAADINFEMRKRFELYGEIEGLKKVIKDLEDKTQVSFNKSASHTNSVRKRLEETEEKLKGEIKSLSAQLQRIHEEEFNTSKKYNKKIDDVESKIDALASDYKELRWQIENLTKIGEDSERLNENTDESQQEALIEAIVNKISANKEMLQTEKHNVIPSILNESIADDNSKVRDESDAKAGVYRDELLSREEFSFEKSNLSQLSCIERESEKRDASNSSFHADGVSLDEEQEMALGCMENTTGNYFITGKAGTGKSFLLKIFQTLTQKTILKVAPTGIAALNIDGVTIHSAFGYKNLNSQPLENLNKDTLSLSSNKKLVLKNMDVLVIDEISMVRADIFDKMDRILRIVCEKEEIPFGGKQVVAFGDLFQLPPIITNKDEEKYLKNKYGGVFFFNSDSYKNGKFSYIELCTNHRQKGDQRFFGILNKIREGSITSADIDLINERYVEDSDSLRRVIKLYSKRNLVERFNEDMLNKIWGEEKVYNAEVTYNRYGDQTYSIENNFQISESLRLKIGAMVMMTRNDPGRRWVNGTLGIVKNFGKNTVFVEINGNTYEIWRADFEMNEAVYQNGSVVYNPIFKVRQFPMILAYAITIHKSQGTTYQQIACDPSDCFAPGQVYVALSRCVDLQGVYLLKKLGRTDIKVDSQVRAFYLSNSKSKST